MTTPLAVGLNAVIVAADTEAPYTLTTQDERGAFGLPHGRFDPAGHRTFERALREWVQEQTGFELGYVEQLYTFGDYGRELPQANLDSAPANARLISVGYLGLTPERTDISAFRAVWRDWYRFFPWEDHRRGRPDLIGEAIAPALEAWAGTDERRIDRMRLAFGLDNRPWIEEHALERYELLYEAGLAAEAVRDRGGEEVFSPLSPSIGGEPMISDHRRILATAIGRLRGKIRYRPVVFELMPEAFTLSELQRTVEAVLGQPLHKQNFRRALDRTDLVEGLERLSTTTGGRPAELYRFRRETIRRGVVLGVPTPRA